MAENFLKGLIMSVVFFIQIGLFASYTVIVDAGSSFYKS